MHEQIFDLLMKEDDISWQGMIHELVRSEQMDPWDVDVSSLASRYIGTLRKMQELNLVISGKVILASAILLKLKSSKLLTEDLFRLENMMKGGNDDDDFDDDDDYEPVDPYAEDRKRKPILLPKTPQPRKRKVSVYDLIEALQKALDGKKRRALREIVKEMPALQAPEKKIDISIIISQLLTKIDAYFDEVNDEIPLKFSDLAPTKNREDQVYTFIPLLQLTNDRHIDLHQPDSFDEIHISKVRMTKEELLALEEEREKKRIAEEEKLAKEEAKNKKKKGKRKKKQAKKTPLQVVEAPERIRITDLEEARNLMNSAIEHIAERSNKQ